VSERKNQWWYREGVLVQCRRWFGEVQGLHFDADLGAVFFLGFRDCFGADLGTVFWRV